MSFPGGLMALGIQPRGLAHSYVIRILPDVHSGLLIERSHAQVYTGSVKATATVGEKET